MAENKTKPHAGDVQAFLAAVEPEVRKQDAHDVCALMSKATGEPPVMWGPSIIGFGARHYRYESGREGDICKVGFSPRKNALVFYIWSPSERFAELKGRLGKYTTGKSCLYVKRLADVDTDVLGAMVAEGFKAERLYSE
jgi:hypothetical protein